MGSGECEQNICRRSLQCCGLGCHLCLKHSIDVLQFAAMDGLLDSLLCPITRAVPEDPVLGADGHIYSAKALETWLQSRNCSPITQQEMHISRDVKVVFAITNVCAALRERLRSVSRAPRASLTSNTRIVLLASGKEEVVLRNLISRHATRSGGELFGSNSYMRFLHESDISAFHIECRKERVPADVVYDDMTFHSQSWEARHRRINDVDIFFKAQSDVQHFKKTLEDIGQKRGLVIRHLNAGNAVRPRTGRDNSARYAESTFTKYHTLMRTSVILPLGLCDSVHVKIDIVSNRAGVASELRMGWYPNVIKTICRTQHYYYFRMRPRMDADHTMAALDACKRMHRNGVSMTSVISKDMIPLHVPDSPCGDVQVDVCLYCENLWKELLAGVRLVNISARSSQRTTAESGLRSLMELSLFDAQDRRTDNTIEVDCSTLKSLACATSSAKLRRGVIEHSKDSTIYHIHYLMDPDFRVLDTEYAALDYVRDI